MPESIGPQLPSDSPSQSVQPVEPLVLSYAKPTTGRMVTIATFASEFEAALPAEELRSAAFVCQLTNTNVNSLGFIYGAFSPVELQVPEEDAEEAKRLLEAITAEDFEPALDSPDESRTKHDEEFFDDLSAHAAPANLFVVASFAHLRLLRKAQTILASAHIQSVGPRLVRRPPGQPPGEGKRFPLHVAGDDVERAAQLLREDEDDTPRCPRCSGWRLYPVGRGWSILLSLALGRPWPQPRLECLSCHYQGDPAEFEAASEG